MSEGSPKSLVFEQFALVAKALGNRHRLELLDILVQGERNVERLASAAGLNIGNASQHLKELRRAGLVSSRKMGTQVIYSLADGKVITLVRTLWHVAERNVAAVGRIVHHYYQRRDELDNREAAVRHLAERGHRPADHNPDQCADERQCDRPDQLDRVEFHAAAGAVAEVPF